MDFHDLKAVTWGTPVPEPGEDGGTANGGLNARSLEFLGGPGLGGLGEEATTQGGVGKRARGRVFMGGLTVSF